MEKVKEKMENKVREQVFKRQIIRLKKKKKKHYNKNNKNKNAMNCEMLIQRKVMGQPSKSMM